MSGETVSYLHVIDARASAVLGHLPATANPTSSAAAAASSAPATAAAAAASPSSSSGPSSGVLFLPQATSARHVACGAFHTAAVGETGRVVVWGLGRNGQLGIGMDEFAWGKEVAGDLAGKNVVMVAAGTFHNLAVLDSGDVYAWGWGADGRLGCGSNANALEPALVIGLQGQFVVSVACGEAHSAAVTQDGRLYMWGSSTDGQIGIRGARGNYSSPMKIDALNGVKLLEVACGSKHTLALTDGGQVLSWGRGGHGRLGHGGAFHEDTPRHIESLRGLDVVSIAAGGMHSAAITSDGELYTWGHNVHGQLGHGTCETEHLPKLVAGLKDVKVAYVACGPVHTAIVSRDRRVFVCGRNLEDLEPRLVFTEVRELAGKPVSHIACSAVSTIALVGESNSSSLSYRKSLQESERSNANTYSRRILAASRTDSAMSGAGGGSSGTASTRVTLHTALSGSRGPSLASSVGNIRYATGDSAVDKMSGLMERECYVCDVPFSQLTRPWRCRNCFHQVCEECFHRQVQLPYPGLKAENVQSSVCAACAKHINALESRRSLKHPL